jgi:hypothetical protein
MGCGCGGQATTPVGGYTSLEAAPVPSGDVYVVTFPDGRSKTYDYEGDAYRAIRLTGGGVQRKPR